jgi:hypothetical protein
MAAACLSQQPAQQDSSAHVAGRALSAFAEPLTGVPGDGGAPRCKSSRACFSRSMARRPGFVGLSVKAALRFAGGYITTSIVDVTGPKRLDLERIFQVNFWH